MNNVNKTLYIPLYGKALVSKKGIIINDEKAEEIWDKEGFELKGKSKSKWLAYYMGMRASVFDDWLRDRLKENNEAVVVHIGCGMDSRNLRVGTGSYMWYDVDFPEVIEERKKYYTENEPYHMIGADARDTEWLKKLPANKNAIVIMEGVSMYFQINELKELLCALKEHFEDVQILMDCYTEFAAKASKYKNPINDVGVTKVTGIDNPKLLEDNTGLTFARELNMTPGEKINELKGLEKVIFKTVYGGSIAKKMYRLYEFR